MAPRFIAQQLSHPAGFLGFVIMQLMNRNNARMNAFALETLRLAANDRALEVGFGGGLLLPRLLAEAAFVAGVDPSSQAVASAKSRFAEAVRNGRADFREGRVEALPFGSGGFDKVVTVNTVYFWKSLESGFGEIQRVLKAGGTAVIGFLPKNFMDKMNMPADIFTTRAPNDIVSAMHQAGFADVRIERPDTSTKWNVAVGRT